jgi:hypothetical protein
VLVFTSFIFLSEIARNMKNNPQIKLAFLLLLTFLGANLSAQTVGDALRYTALDYGGTARFVGSGSSMSSIGPDLGTLSINPAGIGLFRKSEYTLSPGLLNANINSTLLSGRGNTGSSDTRSNFNVQNFGLLFASNPLRQGAWKNINFAIAANNIANFNREFYYEGRSKGSLTQRFQELANNGEGNTGFETGLASDASAIYDFDPTDGIYEIDYELNDRARLFRAQAGTQRGSMTELSFGFAGNYNEKVAVGISLGVPMLSFIQNKTYSEKDDSTAQGGAIPYFQGLRYIESLNTSGSGINAKIGVILRPNQALRLSAAVHTPTAFTLTDDYSNTLENDYFKDQREQGEFLGKTADRTGTFQYDFSTPWRFIAGAGIVAGKNGFLSGEIERVVYTQSRFNYADFPEAEEDVNSEIRDQLRAATNVRLGGELVLDAWRLRAGYAINPSAFNNDDSRRTTLSLGGGYRGETFYVDLAYRRSSFTEQYYPYVVTSKPIQEVRQEVDLSNVVLTLGVKF